MNSRKHILAFIAIDIACFLTILDSTIVNVSLPNMADYFHTSTNGISWVSTAYLIAFSALLVNFAKIADIFGRKKLFLIGLMVFGISSVLCGMADSLGLLIFFRVMQGVGAAILTPLSIPIGIDLFGKNSMGKLSVIIGLTISISAASGPVLGGILNEFFSYRGIFYVNIPFVILAIVLGALYIRESYDNSASRKVDILGSLLLSLALGTLTFLLIKGNEYGWTSLSMLGLVAVTVVSLLLFYLVEKKSANPMVDFALFKVPTFTASILLIAIFFYAYMPISYLINFFFENHLGYSVLHAGLMMGIPSLTALLVTPLMPLMAKKMSLTTVSILTVSLGAGCNFVLSFLNKDNALPLIVVAFILMGIGVRVTTILYQSVYMDISLDKNGIASGIQNSVRQIAACIAIALVSTLSTHYQATAVSDSKEAIVAEIQDSTLPAKVKNLMETQVQSATGNQRSDSVKTAIALLIKANPSLASAAPELERIADDIKEQTDSAVYSVYEKCFFISGIIALAGFAIVPFNRSKKESELSEAVAS